MLRARQKFGKYTIERKLGEGGFAVVYQARDNIEGIRVALKMPYAHLMNEEALKDFRHEVRVAARLEHPNILPLKYADFIDGRFVIVTALGEGTLDERLQKRLSVVTAMDFAAQMLAAVAFAHEHRIIHCDLKPDNFLIFPENRLRLTDFGIARVAQKTLQGSGAGTLGYIAPEQAMGRPSFRSDVFSLGVIFYRIFSGHLPEWPYRWPPPRFARLRSRVHPDLISLIRKAIEVDARKRFRDVRQMEQAFLRLHRPTAKRRRHSKTVHVAARARTRNGSPKWEALRRQEFQRLYGKQLETRSTCPSCAGPISEAMQNCPWCGKKRRRYHGTSRFPLQCPRCWRGMKLDWHYCPWCYGPGFEPSTQRQLSDRRYVARCENPRCDRQQLMRFMKYCPWCRHRVKRKWKIKGVGDKCGRCGWGTISTYWSFCPWCGTREPK
jgi:serine/threonine-protein kinase